MFDELGDVFMYRIKFNPQKFKRIPKKVIIFEFLLWILFALLIVVVSRPANYVLLDSQTVQLKIDRVSVVSTGSRWRSKELLISSEDRNYYLLYPQGTYRSYSEVVDTYLLSGNTTVVTAKVIPNNIVRDALRRRTQIVDLRADNAVFFDVEDRIKDDQINRVVCFPVTVIVGVMAIANTIFIAMLYGVIEFGKPRKKKRKIVGILAD